MPRYDYECETCSHRFELRQSFDSEPVAACPQCENRAVRQFHAVPIVFKGSGWYVNDYGKKSSSTLSSAEPKRDGASDGSSADSKAESSGSSSSSNGASASSSKKESSSTSSSAS